jgi:EAL domain-containing protein (putative c-di-GMP-specific phosphodiesterase class I)/ActR/RegA family two-component response regulator
MRESVSALRIVLVDDEPFVLKILSTMLSQLGFEKIVSCATGEQGLRELMRTSSSVDLIFLDINMPGMDGVEFIRRLVECRYAGAVVLVSGEDGRMLDSISRLLGAHRLKSLGVLQKPVRREELLRVMKELKPNRGQGPASTSGGRSFGIEDLRQAVASGKVVNYYQPQTSLKTGELVGVEALVRLQDGQGQLIFPDQFITLAEQQGLICEITRCVLKSSMRQAKMWSMAGHELTIAVNVSMNDLSALDFPDMVENMADVIGIEPRAITLEVTEGQVMRQLSTVLDVLSRLRLKRFRLSIDDFGTGHSSLAQLRDLPFDELKIDRGFVHGASSNSTLRAICDASMRVAKQLSMQTVAEGIEATADWELLREMGCDAAQGYLIARPMSAAEFTRWMSSVATNRASGRPTSA